MKRVILKILNLYTLLLHSKMPVKYRYFVRDNYFSRLIQIKYFINDFIIKNKNKVISYNGEFQQELTFVLPFAYWHYKNNTLYKTISTKYTKDLYFFSPCHEEKYKVREWESNFNYEIPNVAHNKTFTFNKWTRVPYKDYYQNDIFKYKKPILIIANRYNIEWNQPPISFFNLDILDFMLKKLKHKYQIIYNRPLSNHIQNDNSEIKDLDEYKFIQNNYHEVLLMNELYEKHKCKINSFNHLQLLVYANCENFISIHGGTAALASCFGGTNIIFSKDGREHYFNEFSTLFPKLSGANIYHCKNYNDLKEQIIQTYL